MAESLKNIVARRMAKSIADGTMPKSQTRLGPVPSNLIIKHFLELDLETDFESVGDAYESLATFLDVTEITQLRPELSEWFCSMAYNMDLTKLELGELRRWDLYHTDYECDVISPVPSSCDSDNDGMGSEYTVDYDTDRCHMDIIQFLSDTLNPISQEKLTDLAINGKNMIFEARWVEKIGNMLPSLTSLNIEGCPFPDGRVLTICNTFNNLINLDIGWTTVDDLAGLGRLPHLESLNISGLEFEEHPAIESLFELTKLKELRMTGMHTRSLSATFKHFLEHTKLGRNRLPNLEYIDASFNDLDLHDLRQLTRSHDMIKKISLIGCPIKLGDTKFENVIVYTTETMTDSLDSMELYVNRKQRIQSEIMKKIIASMNNMLVAKTVSSAEMKRCLAVLCSMDPYLFRFRYGVLTVLEALSRGTLVEALTVQEKVMLLNTLLTKYRFLENANIGIKTIVFQMLERKEFLGIYRDMTARICLEAAYFLHDNHDETRWKSVRSCIKILLGWYQHMNREQLQRLDAYDLALYMGNIMRKPGVLEFSPRLLNQCVNVMLAVYRLRENRNVYNDETDEKSALTLCDLIAKTDNQPDAQLGLIVTLTAVLSVSRSHDVILQVDTFLMLVNLINCKRGRAQKILANMFITLYFTLRIDPYFQENTKLTNVLDDVLNDFMQAIATFDEKASPLWWGAFAHAMKFCKLWETERIFLWYYDAMLEKIDRAEQRGDEKDEDGVDIE